MSFPPTVADFKALFNREFVYGTSLSTVQDQDIQRGLNEAGINFNQGLWDGNTPVGTTTEQNIAYLYVSAHFLSLNIQGAGGLSPVNMGRGVKSSGGGTIQTKSVGSVSIAYAIPMDIQNSPSLGQFMRTDFGQKYLAMLSPRLVATTFAVAGNFPIGGGLLSSIYPYPLQIRTTMLPGGTHSVPYSQQIVALGGAGQYSWTISSGSLPTGLSINALTGVVSGTPSSAATYFFDARVTDVLGNQATQGYTVVIA